MAKPTSRLPGFACAHDRVPLRSFAVPHAAGRPGPADSAAEAPQGSLRHERLCPAPLSWARTFPGTPQHAHAARWFAAGVLIGSPLREDAVVVLSELFTNAVRHTSSGMPGGLVTVQVSRWRRGVRIAVTDQGAGPGPAIREPAAGGELAETGNGLFMVSCLASQLDWHDDASGRTICAILGKVPPDHPAVRLATPSWAWRS